MKIPDGEPTGMGAATGLRTDCNRTMACGRAAGGLPDNSEPNADCSALTRCTGCHELAITVRSPADEVAGIGWNVTGPGPCAEVGIGA